MATIVIKDLSDSIELDRQAMTTIIGGARTRGRQTFPARTLLRHDSIVNYPRGFAGNVPEAPGARLTARLTAKPSAEE